MDIGHPDYPLPPPRLEQPRHAGNNLFMSPRNQAERDAWAVDRWREGWLFRDIGKALEVNTSCAHEAVQRGLRGPRAAAAEAAARGRDVQRARLERLHDAAMEVMERKHITVSHGKIIMVHDDDTGTDVPLLDDAPVLAAIDRLLRLNESVRKLDGLDAATKVDATVTAVPQDAELQDRLRAAREKVAASERELLDGDPGA